MHSIARNRIEKELRMFMTSPTPGISCSCSDESLHSLTGVIMGAPGTPFEQGSFNVEIQIPERYPFEPPSIKFITPIYHPNIDSKGRICLDTLKLPPQGSWKPHLNLSTVLMMIRVLMAEPGTEDPLMADIWQEYKYDYPTYAEKAKQWTEQYARGEKITLTSKLKTPMAPGLEEKVSKKETELPASVSSRPNDSDFPIGLNALSDLCQPTVPRKRALGLKCVKKTTSNEGMDDENAKKYKTDS